MNEVTRILVEVNGDWGWEGREQFFIAAAVAMRRILIDRARE
jgi:hypothetical protein